MWEPRIPKEVSTWMDRRAWGIHHKMWHYSRRWELNPGMNQTVLDHHGKREDRQEGTSGNGVDFLAMHRSMIQILRSEFPQYDAMWFGWDVVPVDGENPPDPTDRLPYGTKLRPFDPPRLKALDRILNHIDDFSTDDDFGLYIQTRNRPTPENPQNLSPDPETGIHNYLHARFASPNNACDPDLAISMANFMGNIKNQRFWRLHGWIDFQWTRFRQAKGLDDNDPAYLAAMREHDMTMGEMPLMCQMEIPSTPDLEFAAAEFRHAGQS